MTTYADTKSYTVWSWCQEGCLIFCVCVCVHLKKKRGGGGVKKYKKKRFPQMYEGEVRTQKRGVRLGGKLSTPISFRILFIFIVNVYCNFLGI